MRNVHSEKQRRITAARKRRSFYETSPMSSLDKSRIPLPPYTRCVPGDGVARGLHDVVLALMLVVSVSACSDRDRLQHPRQRVETNAPRAPVTRYTLRRYGMSSMPAGVLWNRLNDTRWSQLCLMHDRVVLYSDSSFDETRQFHRISRTGTGRKASCLDSAASMSSEVSDGRWSIAGDSLVLLFNRVPPARPRPAKGYLRGDSLFLWSEALGTNSDGFFLVYVRDAPE